MMSLDDFLSAATEILGGSAIKETTNPNLEDTTNPKPKDTTNPKLKETTNPKLKETNNENEDAVFLEKISTYEDFVRGKTKSPRLKKVSCDDITSDRQKNGEKLTKKSKKQSKKSDIHGGDTDSSDDEQNRDHECAKYNDFGKDIKRLLATDYPSTRTEATSSYSSNKSPSWKKPLPSVNQPKELSVGEQVKPIVTGDVYTDPVFGMRIVKPLISGAVLRERMSDRDAVHMAKLKWYITKLTPEKNWVVAGAVIRKTVGKTSAKGNQYSIWTISDLHGELKTATIFLFGNAHKEMWKITQGTVVGILNPSVLEGRGNGKEEATLSVDNAQKVMIIGQSKDLGQCKSTTKSGEKCTAIVNTNRCEYCVYHVRQEYQKCSSGRSELQSTYAGRGLTALRNKVLGKNEVFYAGKSYSSIPAKKSKKLETQDRKRLAALSGMHANNSAINSILGKTNNLVTTNVKANKQNATRLDISYSQRGKDLELLKKLGGGTAKLNDEKKISDTSLPDNSTFKPSTTVTLEDSKNAALDVIAKLKAKNNALQTKENSIDNNAEKPNNILSDGTSALNKNPNVAGNGISTLNKRSLSNMAMDFPTLSSLGTKTVDLSAPISKRQKDRAKFNAVKYVQRTGPLLKADPMAIHGTSKKRALDNLETTTSDPKKPKVQETEFTSARFKKMMEATSRHMDLLEEHDNEEQEKYFSKLEMKERMEEKMMSTYKLECKAVRCLKCKYTSFSASDLCKAEKHPLKVFDSVKRFFKCGDCGNRTCCLEIIPLHTCKTCGGGRWERTTMMKEKVANTNQLSIRGGEQKFVHSNVSDANLNLLVPDE